MGDDIDTGWSWREEIVACNKIPSVLTFLLTTACEMCKRPDGVDTHVLQIVLYISLHVCPLNR